MQQLQQLTRRFVVEIKETMHAQDFAWYLAYSEHSECQQLFLLKHY